MLETHVAIQGVCAWPNLKILPDGTILAFIFNQPCHGVWEGDLDCWASEDGGFVWRYRSRPCPHEPGTNRMNHAAGFATNGDLVVICSGWSDRPKQGEAPVPFDQASTLRAWVCRSSDGGRTWERTSELPDGPSPRQLIPFGDIMAGEDGTLRASVYANVDGVWQTSMMMQSDDDGRSWKLGSRISSFASETALLHVGGGKWLAASRTPGQSTDIAAVPVDRSTPETSLKRLLTLHVSEDDGETWRLLGPVSLPGQIPAHLLKLADGRIVLTYGNRCPHNLGIDVRISSDGGESWGMPIRLANMGAGDGGYPSTVQRPDGRLVTAFYNKISGSYHLEMSVARWDIENIAKANRPLGIAW